MNGIDNSTIGDYVYLGPVAGLGQGFPGQDYLAITYEGTLLPGDSLIIANPSIPPGCRKICGDPIAFYDPQTSLALVTDWIFPLGILLSLPYESLHERRVSRTLIAVLNWLGSPQTALTATIFNFRQLRQSHRRVLRHVNTRPWHLHCAAYFVLCCLNQFHLDKLALIEHDGEPASMVNILIYGLFRPLSNDQAPDVDLTNQLLVMLAFQLRMLRRRGVIPTLANLATFLVAFAFSVVLAFAELDKGNTPFPLSFGLLVTWAPLLVVFTVVDRNPTSSERTAKVAAPFPDDFDKLCAKGKQRAHLPLAVQRRSREKLGPDRR